MHHLDQLHIIYIMLIAYGIGSVPFGIIVSKAFGHPDLRLSGSGNIGATNAWRTGGKKIGILTFLFDFLKSFIPVIIVNMLYNQDAALIAGCLAVIGHIFPVWLRFCGGKGIASMYGVFFAITPYIGIFGASIWYFIFKKSRFASFASLGSIFGVVITTCIFISDVFIVSSYITLSIIAFFTHRSNICRLLMKTENKL